MRVIILLVVLLFTGFQGYSQTVINSSGASVGSLYYSIGEIAIMTFGSNDYYLTQGYLQPFSIQTTVEQENEDNNYLEIFPNPAEIQINLKTNWQFSKIRIFNLIGELQLSHDFTDSKIDISSLSIGFYLLELYSDKQEIRKIISFIKR